MALSAHGDEPLRKPVGPPPLALRLAAVLAVPLLLYALAATGQKALENYQVGQQAQALRGELRALKEENVTLQQEILRARTDAAIEEIARVELGLVKPGDQAVILVSDRPRQPPPPPALARPAEPPPLLQWWNLFLGAAQPR